MMDVYEDARRYWETDAATYDRARGHVASSAAERAAWRAALAAHLPDPPAPVLDVGAGTGFLALAAARLGHQVTALDISPAMLAGLNASAEAQGVAVKVVEGRAHEPPAGPFSAIVARHLLWTLPDPVGALRAWRRVAPEGRLVLFEGLWGRADTAEAWRARARDRLRRVRRIPPDHHAEYDPEVRRQMPLGHGTHPDEVVKAVEAAGWGPARLQRLNDIEWARLLQRPVLERLLGVTPQFAVRAG